MRTLGAGTAAGAVAGLLACALATGCGSTPAGTMREIAVAATPPPLATAATRTSGAGWAVVEMGGAAGQEGNFWELFVRPAGSTTWRLATPPGVADNGGIEVTGTAGSLTAGFRPSQDLTFSPLAATSDDGASWSQVGPVSPGLAEAPDALASGPGGRLIALTSGGTAELGPSTGARWTRLASVRAVTRTAAGQACGLTGFTAATFGPAGLFYVNRSSAPTMNVVDVATMTASVVAPVKELPLISKMPSAQSLLTSVTPGTKPQPISRCWISLTNGFSSAKAPPWDSFGPLMLPK